MRGTRPAIRWCGSTALALQNGIEPGHQIQKPGFIFFSFSYFLTVELWLSMIVEMSSAVCCLRIYKRNSFFSGVKNLLHGQSSGRS